MYCPKCKKHMPEGMRFCGICGTPLVEEPKKKEKKKKGFFTGLLCGLLIMALIGGIFYLVTLFTGSSRGYRTPEDAALAYFEAAGKGDAEAMVDTFALEEFTDHYDLAAACDYMGRYQAGGAQSLPNTFDYLKTLNLEKRRSDVIQSFTYMYLSFVLPDKKNLYIPMQDGNFENGRDFVKTLNIRGLEEKLSSMEVANVRRVKDLYSLNGRFELGWTNYRENTMKYLKCEDMEELLAELRVDGKTYYQDIVLAKIDGKWYNLQLGGPISWATDDYSTIEGGFLSEEEMRSAVD